MARLCRKQRLTELRGAFPEPNLESIRKTLETGEADSAGNGFNFFGGVRKHSERELKAYERQMTHGTSTYFLLAESTEVLAAETGDFGKTF